MGMGFWYYLFIGCFGLSLERQPIFLSSFFSCLLCGWGYNDFRFAALINVKLVGK